MHHTILEQLAREMVGQPDEWQVYLWESLGNAGQDMIGWRLKGAVVPLKTRGPNKGRPNWDRCDRDTDREVVIGAAQYDAYEAAWVERTGLCPDCVGDAKQAVGWSKATGTKWEPCPACQGTGKAATAVA